MYVTAYIRLLDIRTNDVRSPSSTPFALKYDFTRDKLLSLIMSKHYAGSMVSDRCPLGYFFLKKKAGIIRYVQ